MAEKSDAAAVPSKPPAAGELVAGRYRLERLLGEGGMGTVFLAHDLRLDIDVALKLVRSDLACPQARDRLLEEARVAARVSHPSAVRVLDFVIDEQGCPFIVMQLLTGRPLADALVESVFSPEEAVRMLLPIIGAAAAGHAEGIVHGDIKPENILLVSGPEGPTPKLVDFGVSRLTSARSRRHITQPAAVVGSPEYMSPEQIEGRLDVDARADVWALCVVLYELVTGVTPFRGASLLATMALIQCDEPERRGALHNNHELWWILRRGLAKDRASRWATARELGRALARWALARDIDSDAAGTAISRWLSLSSMPVPPSTRADKGRGAPSSRRAPRPAFVPLR